MIRPAEFFLPAGPVGVLLIHGLTGTPTEIRTVANGLHRAGFTVQGIQLAGHCGDKHDLLQTGWKDWYTSVEAAAEKMQREVDQMFVGGLSMGSVLALNYAIDHPRSVSGLVLYGTTFFYDGWAIPAIGRLSFLLPYLDMLGIGRDRSFVEVFPYGIKNERVRNFITGKMFSGDSAAAGLTGNPWPALAEFYRLSHWVQRRLDHVHTPCLVMHAREDDIASLRNAQLIEKRVSAPVKTVVLDNCYHMITVDQQKEEVIEHSVDFIQRLSTPDHIQSQPRLALVNN